MLASDIANPLIPCRGARSVVLWAASWSRPASQGVLCSCAGLVPFGGDDVALLHNGVDGRDQIGDRLAQSAPGLANPSISPALYRLGSASPEGRLLALAAGREHRTMTSAAEQVGLSTGAPLEPLTAAGAEWRTGGDLGRGLVETMGLEPTAPLLAKQESWPLRPQLSPAV